MKIVKLAEFGSYRFESILRNLIETSEDRNKDWFPALLNKYKTYVEWFFLVDDSNQLIAFSTIQDFGDKQYRILTRYYIIPEYRRVYVPTHAEFAISRIISREQLKFLDINGGYESLFVSLEKRTRHGAAIKLAERMTIDTEMSWTHQADGMYNTCMNSTSKSCWQNICYAKKMPNLSKISYSEWDKLNS